MGSEIAAGYIRENFEPQDRLAVVLLNKRTHDAIQRLSSAERIASEEFQAWLMDQNIIGYDVYVSMNALREDARGRTKADVRTIRHVYLDFDDDGDTAVQKLLAREDLPKPNYLLQTSPGKWQAVWKVEGFEKDHAERLQKGLARETGADPAATDCARVLRIPGFRNHKYPGQPMVKAQSLSQNIFRPEFFPNYPEPEGHGITPYRNGVSRPKRDSGAFTQSERDWAFAKRALSRGEREELVIAAIASYRRFEKYDPRAYAARTVQKAAEAVQTERAQDVSIEPERA